MNRDLISKKTRLEFREFLVGFTLREIAKEFDAAGVNCDMDYQPPVNGERRSLVEQYYHTVNWTDWPDTKKVLQAFEYVLNAAMQSVERMSGNEQFVKHQQREVENLVRLLRNDGFQWVDGRIIAGAGMPALNDIKETAEAFDAKHLAEQIRRIEQSIEADPALAIGTAKELVETCCRTILNERGQPVIGTPNIPTLSKQTFRELKLLPEGVPNSAKGSETIRRLLSNLATITQGLAEIRGLYGTGHGKDGKTQAIEPRHAKLAVGAAAALATFLFETHKATPK